MRVADPPAPRLPATRAVVDTAALEMNMRLLRSVSRAPDLMAVVKANGYGHGAAVAAEAALAGGASWIGVYSIEEAVAVRERGIRAPILAFRPLLAGEAVDYVRNQVTPTIVDAVTAAEISHAAEGARIPFHVKVDTGLHRSGVDRVDVAALVRQIVSHDNLEFQGLYTHFACADEGTPEPTLTQFRSLMDVVAGLRSAGLGPPIIHAANSAAFLDFPETHASMARIGIALYGYHPSDRIRHPLGLVPALSVTSRIIRLHWLAAGDGVGYGHEFRSPGRRLLALVPLGYGDGLPRRLGNGVGSVLVRGRRVPIVGRVSMDQITVDVTAIGDVQVGDEVVWIGRQGSSRQTADDVARSAGTISYEILTGISSRVPRTDRDLGESG